MDNKITTIPKLKNNDIDKYHYTISLLLEGQRKGLLDEKILNNTHQEIIMILKELILKYTKGKSTSVKVETAENIQQSILYVIDSKLSSFSNPDKCLTLIKENNIKNIYEEGLIFLKKIIEESKELYNYIKENRLELPLDVYNSSIDDALPLFFANYDLNFNAHNTMTILDYPLIFDDMKIHGILYVNNYLKTLMMETVFCNHFNFKDIKKLLNNYGRLYGIDYRQIPINIFEIVINNSIFSAILSNRVTDLNITKSQYKILMEIFTKSTRNESINMLDQAIKKVINKLSIKDNKLICFINQYKLLLFSRVLNLIKNNNLHNIIITDNLKTKKEKIIFSSGKSMNDGIFRSLVEKIKNSSNTTDKINLIRTKVKSMDDLLDILSADCIFGNEFKELYKQISNIELAVLAKTIFLDELRHNQLNLSELVILENFEEEWKRKYVEFILELNQKQQRKIELLLNKIEL